MATPDEEQLDPAVISRILAEVRARDLPLPSPKVRRLIRASAGWSSDQVGEVLGVSGATVRRWEEGSREPKEWGAGKGRGLRRRYADLLRLLMEVSE